MLFLFLYPQESEFLEKNTDWIYEWSSRPDQAPPKYENLILYFLIPRKIVRQIDLFIISCVTRDLSIFPFFFFSFTLETGNSSILREWIKENLIAFVQRKWEKLDCSQKRFFILLLSRIFYPFWLELAWGKRNCLKQQ